MNIHGTVMNTGGALIPGVSVVVLGAQSGTTTNVSGTYSISATKGSTIVFSNIGFVTQEIQVGDNSEINIILQEEGAKAMDEIVVVGYGTQRRETLTGSISVVKGSDLVKSPQPNLSNSFAGRFSGLIANNRSGEPGYDGSAILIRGLATTGNNDVLVVVDGVPGQLGGLSRIDPNDIESISILKDASAAVYGSRAANGVILITTKKGRSGKATISYDFNQGFAMPTRLPKMADAATYAQIVNEIDYYNNPAGGMNQTYTTEQIEKFRNSSDLLNYPNTDWVAATLRNTAPQNKQNLSVRGGTEQIRYFASLGTLFQNGIYKNGATKYNQYNFRSNLTANITEDFEVGLAVAGRQEDRAFPIYGAGDIFRNIYRAYPTVSAVYPNELPSTGIENNNPVIMATSTGGTTKNPSYILNGILSANYKLAFVDGMSIGGFYSVDKTFNFSKSFATPYTLYSYDKTTSLYKPVTVGGSSNKATLSQSQTNVGLSTANIKLAYETRSSGHGINTFVSYEQSSLKQEQFGASRLNYPTQLTPELSQGGAAPDDRDNWGSSYNYTRKSYIGRFAYNYVEKYLLELQARLDGSSTFPEGKQYGFFPAGSAGWVISKEDWFHEALPFFNNLKFRASYGLLGNDNIAQFQYFNNYSFNNSYVLGESGIIQPGINLVKLGNRQITWETARKLDIGLNAVFLNDFNIEFIYFQQKRNNILSLRNASIPAVTGIVNPFGGALVPHENIGKVNNNGIETTLGYDKNQGDFRFGLSGNFTYSRNKIIFIDEAPGIFAHQKQTGLPLNTYLLYRATGIFRTQAELDQYPHPAGAKLGDLILEDYNNDDVIDAEDMVRTDLGNIPEIMFGLNGYFQWKNLDMSFVFSGQSRVRQYVLPEAGQVGNFYSSWADNRWSPQNTGGSYPRVDARASSAISGGLFPSTFWLNDASFLRLKNLEIGYNLQDRLPQRIKLKQLRVYANAFNLLTLTKVKDYDPEGDNWQGQFYPQQKIFNIGLNISF